MAIPKYLAKPKPAAKSKPKSKPKAVTKAAQRKVATKTKRVDSPATKAAIKAAIKPAIAAAKNKPAPKKTTPPKKTVPPKPNTSTGAPSAYGNVTTNPSGYAGLQTNHELNMEQLNAEEAYNAEMAQAQADEEQAAITHQAQLNDLDIQKRNDKGRTNANLAYRGMNSGVAVSKIAEMDAQHNLQKGEIDSAKSQVGTRVINQRLRAGTNKDARLGNVILGRQEYTDQRSRDNPTVGTKPVNAGIKPIAPAKTPAAKAKATTPALVKKAAQRKAYKGKYAGPDVFKGNAKQNAAYKKATAGKKLSNAAKRKIAQGLL